MSSRSFPDMMELMSSRSSTSLVRARVFRSMASSPWPSSTSLVAPPDEDLRPTYDRSQRRSQFVREGRQELVFHAAGMLGRTSRNALAGQELCAFFFDFLALGDVPQDDEEARRPLPGNDGGRGLYGDNGAVEPLPFFGLRSARF